jgi:glutathione S-transferase
LSKFTLIIGNKNNSSWSLRGYLAIKHANVDFEEVMVSLRPSLDRASLDRLTPAGKVPTLKHGNNYIWDSLAICEYMNDLHPEKNFWPKNINIRAHARCISAEMHSGFTALRSVMGMACLNKFECPKLTGDLKNDIDRIISIWSECVKQYGSIGPYLFGKYSIADIMYAPVILRFKSYQIELPDVLIKYFDTMINHPDIEEWCLDADPNDTAEPINKL